MPNNETNNVVVIGDPDKIRQFVDQAFIHPGQPFPNSDESNDKDFPVIYFPLIVPQPEGIERGGCTGEHEPGVICWYRWNTDNWGTKWGAYSHSFFRLRFLKGDEDGAQIYGRIDLRFETAWSQPTPILHAIEDRWGVRVHAVTQDEGGYPDVLFGEPLELLQRVVTFEFDSWDSEVTEPRVGVVS